MFETNSQICRLSAGPDFVGTSSPDSIPTRTHIIMKLSPKSIIMALALGLAIVPAISFAQPPAGGAPGGPGGGGRRGGQTPEARVTQIDEAVKLTADQKTKITAILTKAAADQQAMSQEDRRGPKAQEARTATNKEIRALLTAEQQPKFDAIPAPAGRGAGGPGGGGARPPQ